MDKSTFGGTIALWVILLAAILLGGSVLIFLDAPSLVLVMGGTTASLFLGYPTEAVINGIKAVRHAYFSAPVDLPGTVDTLEKLSKQARAEGLLVLERAAESVQDPFLAGGLRMIADGYEPAAIESVLVEKLSKIEQRHRAGIAIFDAIGAYAPAMGLIGTLVGLVQMLQAMDDPTKIGPAMAVALLTTLYGAVLANFVGTPLANKLKVRSEQEVAQKELVIQGLTSILGGENPRLMVERLRAALPPAAVAAANKREAA